jgi:superfamily I DNA and/or RNA helicase
LEISHHLGRMSALLAAERDEERARFSEVRGRLSLAEREARGLAIPDVEVAEEGALGDRALVTFARGGKPLPGGRIGVGSPVSVVRRREVPPDAPQGVVARRTRTQVAVAFDEPPPDWVTDGRVVLELEPSPVTWDRLQAGLTRLRDTAEGKRWHAVLGGARPRFLQAPPPIPAPGSPLNPEQTAAVELADRALDLALVHGPPGTGKTTVLVDVVRRAAARGERVLATAPSNLAVDNLLERLAAAGLSCVRVGHPARVLTGLLEHTLEAKASAHEVARIAEELVDEALALRRDARKRRTRRGPGRFSESRAKERDARSLLAEARSLEARAEAEVLDRAQVVLATLTSLDGPALAGRRFALAVIDEATQALEPAAYLALLRAERAVLAGDPLQLPPTVLSAAAQQGLGTSLFERLADADHGAACVTLVEQHRMNERIMTFPSEMLYQGRLRAHPAVAGWAIDGAPFELVDTAGRGFEEEIPEGSDSRQNPGEAELAAGEVARVLALGVAPAEVAVISPYDAQVQRLRQVLGDLLDSGLEVDTVDGFQGREKDAVIVSLVRSNEEGEVGFLGDVRRMNVAITRARKKLVVIGDGATISRHPFYGALIRHAEASGAWRSAWDR